MQREEKITSFPLETLSSQQGSVEDKGTRALQEAAELSTTCQQHRLVQRKGCFFYPLLRK